jgi:hypothetical protein
MVGRGGENSGDKSRGVRQIRSGPGEASRRRALKRFLNALREGRRDDRETHPANRAWLERHRHLSLGAWLDGASTCHPAALPGHDGAFVRLEDDPQEILKMGAYAETCLAIGGCNQHAAVANSLDANKRVAFLWDSGGRPLARQLLAISEEGALLARDWYDDQAWAEPE